MSCKHEMPLTDSSVKGICTGCGMSLGEILGWNMDAKNCFANPCADQHDWKMYVGFTKVFEYCEHCDEKRPYVEPLVEDPPKPDYRTDSDAGNPFNEKPLTISMIRAGEDMLDAMKYMSQPRIVSIQSEVNRLASKMYKRLAVFGDAKIFIKSNGHIMVVRD